LVRRLGATSAAQRVAPIRRAAAHVALEHRLEASRPDPFEESPRTGLRCDSHRKLMSHVLMSIRAIPPCPRYIEALSVRAQLRGLWIRGRGPVLTNPADLCLLRRNRRQRDCVPS
jgi:hypothetical protein